MADEFTGFDWDEGNREKCQKHGVPVAEIEGLFLAGRFDIRPDLAHSQAEARFLAVGRGPGGRHLFVAFTVREREGERLLRPISARYMHQKEVSLYEEANPRA